VATGNGTALKHYSCDTLIVGAGIIGISTAYYLKRLAPDLSVILVDAGQPMAFTSAQSGENYRNWWPHPVMTAFTNHSIDLMEQIAQATGNRINMNRRGYVLASRSPATDDFMTELNAGYAGSSADSIRVHDQSSSDIYVPPLVGDWDLAPSGVDVLKNPNLIRSTFPSFAHDIRSIVHIRRAGSISGQQLGQYMLEGFRAAGGHRISGKVTAIERVASFRTHLTAQAAEVRSDRIVNAAGPFVDEIAKMMGVRLPIRNTLQQKIAFEDVAQTIPRQMPFSIDLDTQTIDWSEEERELVAEDSELAWLANEMQGGIHCRPDGGDHGTWIRLGWAFSEANVLPTTEPPILDFFPEIVLRGAARLNPSLKHYYGGFPRGMHQYCGYYTMTEENWPLIGEMGVDGAFVAGAMSGFGTMAACASGELCAGWVVGRNLPRYALPLSLERYGDPDLVAEMGALSSRGIL